MDYEAFFFALLNFIRCMCALSCDSLLFLFRITVDFSTSITTEVHLAESYSCTEVLRIASHPSLRVYAYRSRGGLCYCSGMEDEKNGTGEGAKRDGEVRRVLWGGYGWRVEFSFREGGVCVVLAGWKEEMDQVNWGRDGETVDVLGRSRVDLFRFLDHVRVGESGFRLGGFAWDAAGSGERCVFARRWTGLWSFGNASIP